MMRQFSWIPAMKSSSMAYFVAINTGDGPVRIEVSIDNLSSVSSITPRRVRWSYQPEEEP